MTTPVQHCLITGGYLPIILREFDRKTTNLVFKDNFPTFFERFGITRDEMMILMPQVMSVDVLSGLETLRYVGEEETDKSAKK